MTTLTYTGFSDESACVSVCPSSCLNSRFPASQTTCGEPKLITIKQGYLVSSSLTKDIDEGHWQTSPEDKSLNNTWLTPPGLNVSSKFKWFCTQASMQANVAWVTACMANPFQCVCLVHDKEINWNVNKFNECLQWANIGRCCAEFPCLVSLAIKPNCMAHFWCLIKIVQCFPLIKYTPPCTVIFPINYIWQADRRQQYAHILVDSNRQVDVCAISLWIEIQRLHMALLSSIWFFLFKTSWFISIIAFVVCPCLTHSYLSMIAHMSRLTFSKAPTVPFSTACRSAGWSSTKTACMQPWNERWVGGNSVCRK